MVKSKTIKPYNVLTDTGFWIDLLNSKDTVKEQKAEDIFSYIEDTTVIIPFPTLYEFLKTRMVKRTEKLRWFEKFLKKENVILLEDTPYKTSAMEKMFALNLTNRNIDRRTISLVDAVIREMLADTNIKIDSFITFNPSDFQDVCLRRRIEIFPS